MENSGINRLQSIAVHENGSEASASIIVGAGLAGLATAIKLKERCPDETVIVLDKLHSQSNTQIAGQRIRAGISGHRKSSSAEILSLLSVRNDGHSTEEMKLFAGVAQQELDYWLDREDSIEYHDQSNWFGPQLGTGNRAGHGRGHSVLAWFRKTAQDHGVHLVTASVTKLSISGGIAEALEVADGKGGEARIEAGNIILANGSATGSLYHSTNRTIDNSAHELAYDAGLDLVDSTLHMLHPFGFCAPDGTLRTGCFETDQLQSAKVFLNGLSSRPVYDDETTRLLHEHKAHYHFPEIMRRFMRHGSVVKLEFEDGSKLARVGYHYGHMGIDTSDGISVTGVQNLAAVGDASGLGYWTGRKERFPGFALLKCFTDAELYARRRESDDSPLRARLSLQPVQPTYSRVQAVGINTLNDINTEHVLQYAIDADRRQDIVSSWVGKTRLEQIESLSPTLASMSLAVALGHAQRLAGRPDTINQKVVNDYLGS